MRKFIWSGQAGSVGFYQDVPDNSGIFDVTLPVNWFENGNDIFYRVMDGEIPPIPQWAGVTGWQASLAAGLDGRLTMSNPSYVGLTRFRFTFTAYELDLVTPLLILPMYVYGDTWFEPEIFNDTIESNVWYTLPVTNSSALIFAVRGPGDGREYLITKIELGV